MKIREEKREGKGEDEKGEYKRGRGREDRVTNEQQIVGKRMERNEKGQNEYKREQLISNFQIDEK